jgi:broad specificity phosphatase PhoE
MFAANYDALSELGRVQAARLGVVWAAQWGGERPGFDAVFSGPAQRHLDTTALIGEGFAAAGLRFPDSQTITGFDEHDGQGMVERVLARVARGDADLLGSRQAELLEFAKAAMDPKLERAERSRSWQRLYEAIMRRWLADELRLDGVETWPEFRARIQAAFAEVRERARGEVVVVTSVGPIAAILFEVLGLTAERAFEQAWRVYNCSVSRVIHDSRRMTLDGFNEVAHLPRTSWTHR